MPDIWAGQEQEVIQEAIQNDQLTQKKSTVNNSCLWEPDRSHRRTDVF